MSRSFWSLPAGWRKALPWGVLSGLLVVAAVSVLEGHRAGWDSLDRIFWIDVAVCFPFLVIAFTAFGARFWADRDRDDEPKP